VDLFGLVLEGHWAWNNFLNLATRIDMAKANSKSAPCSTSKKKYASKFLQAWVGDLHCISRSDRGLSHAICRICNSHFSVAAGGWPALEAIGLSPWACVLLGCYCCPSQTATQTARSWKRLIQTVGLTLARTQNVPCSAASWTQRTVVFSFSLQKNCWSLPSRQHGSMWWVSCFCRVF